jgi:hypothetical protein
MIESAHDKRPLGVTLLLVAAVAGIVGLSALRFIHLGADPPGGVTRSGVFYTDEGWYSRNAVSRHLGGPWIVEGDFNPVVNMPVLQAVNYAMFESFGMGLAQARVAGTIAFVGTLVLLFLALRRRIRREPLLVVLLLLSCNFLLFTFSRTAIAENMLMLFVVASMYFAIRSQWSRPVMNASLSALCFSLAVLTKLIGAFFLPVMVFFLWGFRDEEGSMSAASFFKKLAAAAAVLVIVFGGYYLLVISPHRGDFMYFNALNIARRIKPFGDESAAIKAIYVVKGSSLRAAGLSFIVFVSGMMSVLLVLFSQRLKRDPLMIAMLLWIFFYLGIIAINGYAPPRYYIPLMIPLTVLMVHLAFWLPGAVGGRIISPALAALGIVLIGASLATNTLHIARYMRKPVYTFRNMSRRIGEVVRLPGETEPSLLGHFANSISLEADIPSYNDSFRTWSIERLLARYNPRYYVCYGPVEKINPLDEYYEASQYLLNHYILVLLARFDALNNYYRGVPVYLYRIEQHVPEPDGTPAPETGGAQVPEAGR